MADYIKITNKHTHIYDLVDKTNIFKIFKYQKKESF